MARQQEKDPRCRRCGHRDGIRCGKTAAYCKSLAEGQDAHGWMTAAPLRAMRDLRARDFRDFRKARSMPRDASPRAASTKKRCGSTRRSRCSGRGGGWESILTNVTVEAIKHAVFSGLTTVGRCLTHKCTSSR